MSIEKLKLTTVIIEKLTANPLEAERGKAKREEILARINEDLERIGDF